MTGLNTIAAIVINLVVQHPDPVSVIAGLNTMAIQVVSFIIVMYLIAIEDDMFTCC